MCNMCNTSCIYYPNYPNKIYKEYVDEFGIKHRESEFICSYDSHRILSHEKCKNYKSIKEIKKYE